MTLLAGWIYFGGVVGTYGILRDHDEGIVSSAFKAIGWPMALGVAIAFWVYDETY